MKVIERVRIPLKDGWKTDPEWQANMEAKLDLPAPRPLAVRKDPLAALVGREMLSGDADYRWHISLQHFERVPDWDELVAAAHSLRPGVPFVIGIPPRSWWINVHPNVLHLYETFDDTLIDQWRFERKGQAPS